MGNLRIVSRTAFAVACLTLSSCALVDTYSDRATVYSLEAEQAQEKAILLNVIRGSLRRPMQFTTVTSIIGTASVSGSGGYAAPVNVPFRSSGGSGSYPALDTWTASASLSGGETFTVPVLDTQEFYQGILKPIPAQFYDLLVQQRYPVDLLFNLFIQKVVMRVDDENKSMRGNDDNNPTPADGDRRCKASDHTARCEHVFRNYVSRNDEIIEFQLFAHYLLRAGLTTEAIPKKKDAPLPKPRMNINLKLIGGLARRLVPLGSQQAERQLKPRSPVSPCRRTMYFALRHATRATAFL